MPRPTLTALLLMGWAAGLAAQDAAPAGSDSGPTPAQKRYLDGLKTAGRGVAQVKDGIERVFRTRGDSTRYRQASQRLGGLCGAARGFLTRGQAQMSPSAYEDTTRLIARQLVQQIDSLARAMPACQREAGTAGERVANDLVVRLRQYEVALQRYRVAIGLEAPPRSPAGGRRD